MLVGVCVQRMPKDSRITIGVTRTARMVFWQSRFALSAANAPSMTSRQHQSQHQSQRQCQHQRQLRRQPPRNRQPLKADCQVAKVTAHLGMRVGDRVRRTRRDSPITIGVTKTARTASSQSRSVPNAASALRDHPFSYRLQLWQFFFRFPNTCLSQ